MSTQTFCQWKKEKGSAFSGNPGFRKKISETLDKLAESEVDPTGTLPGEAVPGRKSKAGFFSKARNPKPRLLLRREIEEPKFQWQADGIRILLPSANRTNS